MARRRLHVDGIVQGVGFRPFVYNLARSGNLTGFVTNTSAGVFLEIEGDDPALDRFEQRLQDELPPLARIVAVESMVIDPVGDDEFTIRISRDTPGTSTLIPPDVATCADCLREMRDPDNRRHGYAFTNCTNCGPRWTIIDRIPYDRPYTSMAEFTMCAACQAEYDDPDDRRFHAQPNACAECGPQLWLADGEGHKIESGDAIGAAVERLVAGRIVAIKGLGGFHLAVRADDDDAVRRLRERKHREAKPLAVMVRDNPAFDDFLRTPQAPIGLLRRDELPAALNEAIAPAVAPEHRRLGVMLPYTPLHHLLLDEAILRGIPALVMTSGNASDEPICLDNAEALERLAGIADNWLLHDRGILRRADDSVAQLLDDEPLFFRRSRGWAPVPILLGKSEGAPVLAVGPELKNTICLLKENRAFLSPHVGDLENLKTYEFFTETTEQLQTLLECEPDVIAHDLHPGYLSTSWAREAEKQGKQLIGVQHHHAHLAAVLAEHDESGPAVGLILDGTGYGLDGTIWGGEILVGDASGVERAGHLQTLRLPGAETAIRQPWRLAVAVLCDVYGPDRGNWPDLPWLDRRDVGPVLQILERDLNCPVSSSCGRLFDAIAALTGRWGEVHYEAQAAIEWMSLTSFTEVARAEPWPMATRATKAGPFALAFDEVVRGVGEGIAAGERWGSLSARFHATLIHRLTEAVVRTANERGMDTVALGGGSLQNELLLRGLIDALQAAGLRTLRPVQTPAGDGAIALGQAVVARARLD